MLSAYVLITSHLATLRAKHEERGATAVEYGLMVALIAVAIIATVTAVGGQLNTLFGQVKTGLTGPAAPPPAGG